VDYPKIKVVCNQRTHKDGKVAHIDTFARLEHGWMPVEMLFENSPKHHGWGDGRRTSHAYECRLCGLFLEGSDDVLQEALDKVAAQGVSETTLYVLTVLASRRT